VDQRDRAILVLIIIMLTAWRLVRYAKAASSARAMRVPVGGAGMAPSSSAAPQQSIDKALSRGLLVRGVAGAIWLVCCLVLVRVVLLIPGVREWPPIPLMVGLVVASFYIAWWAGRQAQRWFG
jgi:hypothetical protein